MQVKGFLFFSLFILSLSVSGLYFSKHGIRDFIKLDRLVAKTHERSVINEKENQKLRRRLKSLENPEEMIRERELREFLGWVKSEEWVYLEKSRQ